LTVDIECSTGDPDGIANALVARGGRADMASFSASKKKQSN
jgi:hypothetical protein